MSACARKVWPMSLSFLSAVWMGINWEISAKVLLRNSLKFFVGNPDQPLKGNVSNYKCLNVQQNIVKPSMICLKIIHVQTPRIHFRHEYEFNTIIVDCYFWIIAIIFSAVSK